MKIGVKEYNVKKIKLQKKFNIKKIKFYKSNNYNSITILNKNLATLLILVK